MLSRWRVRGFTLIELLVVIAIIAILAAILFPVFAQAREQARKASCQSNLKQMATGLMMYTNDFDERYPSYNWGRAVSDPWWYTMQPYVKNYKVLECPSNAGINPSLNNGQRTTVNNLTQAQLWQSVGSPLISYGMCEVLGNSANGDGINIAGIQSPAQKAMLSDGVATVIPYWGFPMQNCNAGGGDCWRYALRGSLVCPTAGNASRHQDTNQMAFCDGHVKVIQPTRWANPCDGTNYRALWNPLDPNAFQ
jgi:prepilin-type N-terminal cleavage/methylation domain-containing protein/prepilin-type processing-associated H-X9-DG protein